MYNIYKNFWVTNNTSPLFICLFLYLLLCGQERHSSPCKDGAIYINTQGGEGLRKELWSKLASLHSLCAVLCSRCMHVLAVLQSVATPLCSLPFSFSFFFLLGQLARWDRVQWSSSAIAMEVEACYNYGFLPADRGRHQPPPPPPYGHAPLPHTAGICCLVSDSFPPFSSSLCWSLVGPFTRFFSRKKRNYFFDSWICFLLELSLTLLPFILFFL